VWGRIALPLPVQVLEEDDHSRVFLDADGIKKRVLKDGMSMPDFLEYPIRSREDWEALKADLDVSLARRVPPDWDGFVASLRGPRSFPVSLLGYPEGLFGQLREMVGAERLLTSFYDEPAMIHDMLDTLTDLWLCLWEEMLALFQPESVTFWEDMCYRAGPLISPKMFRAFLLPRYQRLTAFGRSRGIHHFLVDSDGDMRKLIPLWIEGGISGVYPFEVQAGMNVEEIGAAYPDLVVLGGIDKREVVKGPAAIDAELERRMPFLLQRGGFIPTLDHHVTSEVSWENYVYYRRRVAEYCERYSPSVRREK
jgi:uroporphyrinogen decarboxylase